MKKIFISVALVLTVALTHAQSGYEILPDNNGTKFLKGIISREILEKDSAFNKLFTSHPPNYAPYPAALDALKKNVDSINLLVFMGTWCEDSYFVIPRLFFLLDAAGFSRDRVSLVATDHDKKTLGHLSETMGVSNVPTIIVMKKGKELGRVVEYGKSGMFDKDLALVLNPAP